MRTFQIGDMFCGAGGSTTGIQQAIDAMGCRAKIWAFNHWNIAIDTHSSNYADVNHICASVENLDPTTIFPKRELDLLWASPACTHHSVARGGRPKCEQQRAPAWIILHWLENLNVKRVIIENVPEFRNWGPLDNEGRIIRESKGLTFQAFITGIKSLGYSVDYRVLNAADYGDPTVRKRLFIQAIKGAGREITWPNITHVSKQDEVNLPQWIPAREHFAQVEPDVEYAIDIRFRMLQPHEEAAAMSFPKEYLFRGNKGDIQKQIGNAVPVRLSRALAENILSVEVA